MGVERGAEAGGVGGAGWGTEAPPVPSTAAAGFVYDVLLLPKDPSHAEGPTVSSHILHTAVVSYTPNVPERDVGVYADLQHEPEQLSEWAPEIGPQRVHRIVFYSVPHMWDCRLCLRR